MWLVWISKVPDYVSYVFYFSPDLRLTLFEGAGHDIQEMLQECVFLGKTCGPRSVGL